MRKPSMTEKKLWHSLKSNLPKKTFCQRIENRAGEGMPDTYLMADGVPLWVELKVTKNDRVSVRPSQIAWHSAHNRCGGVSFFLILHDQTGDLYSFDGGRAAEIADSRFSDLCRATSAVAIDRAGWVAALRAGLL